MTVFHLLAFVVVVMGLSLGAEYGARFGSLAGVCGAIIGGVVGYVVGQAPFVVGLLLTRQYYNRKSVEELRGMLLDREFPAPNTILLELRSRGVDLEQELPVVLDMLTAPTRERRLQGWHALASAYPERAQLLTDYNVEDTPEECGVKIKKLRQTQP